MFQSKLPSKLDRLALEVIAKAEIAQHFEEGVVTRGVPHILEVIVLATRANTFAQSRADKAAAPSPKRSFKLVHASIGEEQSGVVCRH